MQGAPLARLAQCPRLQLPEGLASPSQELLSSMVTLVTKYLVLDHLKLSCWSSPSAAELDRKSYGMAPLSPSSQSPVRPLTESFHPVSLGHQPSDLILPTILPLLDHSSPFSQRPKDTGVLEPHSFYWGPRTSWRKTDLGLMKALPSLSLLTALTLEGLFLA